MTAISHLHVGIFSTFTKSNLGQQTKTSHLISKIYQSFYQY